MNGHIVAAQQPNYLPWVGYFHKIHKSDTFVFLDDVDYTGGNWINRNRIKTPDGWTWLTVPVTSSSNVIRHTKIAQNVDWQDEHRKSLQHNYGRAPHYDGLSEKIKIGYDRDWVSLASLNKFLITEITDLLGFECEFVSSAELNVSGTESERLIEICETLGADTYLSGTGAKSYMDDKAFEAAGIAVEYQSFDHPTYPQRYGEFISDLSIVDMLFNCGPKETAESIKKLGGADQVPMSSRKTS